MAGRDHQGAQQMTAFLGAVAAAASPEQATRDALQHAAEAVDADLAALVCDGNIPATLGFRGGQAPVQQLLDVAAGRRHDIVTGSLHAEHTFVARVPTEGTDIVMVFARCGEDPFTGDDIMLLRGMIQVLALSLRTLTTLHNERTLRVQKEQQAAENLELVRSLRERQSLLEAMSGISRLINRRIPSDEVLHEITSQAREHLAADLVLLVRRETADLDNAQILSTAGTLSETWRGQQVRVQGILLPALGADGVVVDVAGPALGFLPGDAATRAPWADLVTVLATPVHEDGLVVGALVVGRSPESAGGGAGSDVLLAFAEQTSIVLTDARTAEDMHRALHDPLTGLLSRSLFLDRVGAALHADESGASVGVLFIDLDGFKLVNDTLGHAAGDKVLTAVAARLRQCVREEDVIGRIGGDEFSLLVCGRHASEEALARLADRIVDAMKDPFPLYGRQVYVGASVGIARSTDRGTLPEELVRNADVAMYRAKSERRGRLIFRQDMQQQLVETLEAEAELRIAIEHDELVLQYQPVISLHDRKLTAFEALVRWDHPRRGRLAPADFLPLAEQTRLIIDVDRWVIRRACGQAGEWKRQYGQDVVVHINVSGHGLLFHGMIGEIGATIKEHDLAPESVVVELTEAVLVRDLDAVSRALRGLQEIGVRMAIDDFGTGYSSLSYLHSLPFEVLKIDRSFVNGLDTDPVKAALVRGVVNLGRELGLEVVAEGIESQWQLDSLASAGCHAGQGFFIDRPLEAAAAGDRVRDATGSR